MSADEQVKKSNGFGLDAYSPSEVEAKVEVLGVKKARMPFLASFLLSIMAGVGIGLGGLFFCIVLADSTLSFAVQRVLGGIVFSVGLSIVLIAGAELFTGNCLIVMSWANRQISAMDVLGNWLLVWVGNLVGALLLVFLVFMSHHAAMNNGAVGAAVLKLAVAKITPDFTTLFFKGILCNLLVCLAVWMSYAGRSVTDKIVGLTLPIAAFVAAGFEHCVANMYFLPLAAALKMSGQVPAGLDVSAITLSGIAHNLIPATLGNIVGGAVFVGFFYWLVYRKSLGDAAPLPKAEE